MWVMVDTQKVAEPDLNPGLSVHRVQSLSCPQPLSAQRDGPAGSGKEVPSLHCHPPLSTVPLKKPNMPRSPAKQEQSAQTKGGLLPPLGPSLLTVLTPQLRLGNQEECSAVFFQEVKGTPRLAG